MEQQIRFCTTSDGVSIAYATVGEGPPLIRAVGWFTHLEFERQSPIWRHVVEGLARKHMFVRYDGRGTGLSDREIGEISSERRLSDLESVVDALELSRFALWGLSEGSATAVAYAVRHPERVSRLILYGSFARWPHEPRTEQGEEAFRSMVTLMRQGWGKDNPAFRQIFTSFFIPDGTAEQMRWFNEMERASTSSENAVKLYSALREIDVRDLLPQVRTPTLVIHRRGDVACPFDGGRELAGLIPNARFLPLEGNNHLFLEGEPEFQTFLQAVEQFTAEDRKPAKRKPRKAAPPGLVTILFTDMEGSTSLTQRLGDAKAQELLRTHNTIVRDALKNHGGAEIKHTGDGIMASFATASKALACATAIQTTFAEHNEAAAARPSTGSGLAEVIRVRIGLNAGEPVAEEEDLFGTAVQLAARVCAQAEPGQVLAANVVRELAAGKPFLFSDQGDVVLRGFEDPVRLYEVRGG